MCLCLCILCCGVFCLRLCKCLFLQSSLVSLFCICCDRRDVEVRERDRVQVCVYVRVCVCVCVCVCRYSAGLFDENIPSFILCFQETSFFSLDCSSGVRRDVEVALVLGGGGGGYMAEAGEGFEEGEKGKKGGAVKSRTVWISGRSVRHLRPDERNVACVLQTVSFFWLSLYCSGCGVRPF